MDADRRPGGVRVRVRDGTPLLLPAYLFAFSTMFHSAVYRVESSWPPQRTSSSFVLSCMCVCVADFSSHYGFVSFPLTKPFASVFAEWREARRGQVVLRSSSAVARTDGCKRTHHQRKQKNNNRGRPLLFVTVSLHHYRAIRERNVYGGISEKVRGRHRSRG